MATLPVLAHAETITTASQRRLNNTHGLLLATNVLRVACGARLIALVVHIWQSIWCCGASTLETSCES
jgi:fatty acid desaturase